MIQQPLNIPVPSSGLGAIVPVDSFLPELRQYFFTGPAGGRVTIIGGADGVAFPDEVCSLIGPKASAQVNDRSLFVRARVDAGSGGTCTMVAGVQTGGGQAPTVFQVPRISIDEPQLPFFTVDRDAIASRVTFTPKSTVVQDPVDYVQIFVVTVVSGAIQDILAAVSTQSTTLQANVPNLLDLVLSPPALPEGTGLALAVLNQGAGQVVPTGPLEIVWQ